MTKQFGDRLYELRVEKGLTQEELAKTFNTGKASISHYESNRRVPDAGVISKYADFFNVSLEYMLGKSNVRDRINENIINNIKLIIGDAPVSKFVENVHEKTGFDFPTIEDIELYLSGSVMPSIGVLQVFARYMNVDIDIFEKKNTLNDFKVNAKFNDNKIENKAKKIMNKIVEHDIDLDAVDGMIDIMISQKKK